jgi:hypothetical protein
MPTTRLMSPEFAFTVAMRATTEASSSRGTTITKTEAQKAVSELSQHPHATATERATIVQKFLDGAGGQALSPKARDVLVDFVQREQSAPTGQRADELKAQATSKARAAEGALKTAKGRIDQLVAEGRRVKKADLVPVQTALDGARAAVDAARGALSGVLQVADHTASLADRQLKDAQGELKKAQRDLARLAQTKGAVTKKAVADVQRWLADPIAELRAARAGLGGAQPSPGQVTTMKAPSDHEDGGAQPSPAPQPMTTRKYPSDAEDGGASSGGGGTGSFGVVTLKYPSDNEDQGGGVVTTMKAPSDQEDGGPAPADGATGGPAGDSSVKPARAAAIRKVFDDAEKKGIAWKSSMPIGQRFESVPLKQERRPDGYAYEALIPVSAMVPNARRKDPNDVDTFWMRRTGGVAGRTQYAGPFSLPTTTSG